MSEPNLTETFSKSVTDKYWIKTGMEVVHRDFPERKMVVDQIVKKSVPTIPTKDDRRKTFIVGVDCHWITKTGEYGKGRFLTMELEPFEKTKA
jgi:hypothetical protein